MKIERIRSFTPVVITLETEEELEALVFNLGATSKIDIERTYLSSRGRQKCDSAFNIGYKMYNEFSSVLKERE